MTLKLLSSVAVVFSLALLAGQSCAFIDDAGPKKNPSYVKSFKPFTLLVDQPKNQVAGDPLVIPTGDKSAVNHPASAGAVAQRNAAARKKWGLDNKHEEEYWFDYRIHTLGNVGFGGALHAALAPISTKIIDMVAYDGIDIRAQVAEKLSSAVTRSNPRVLDLCCGVGISTRALKQAFPDAETVIGVDTSPQMIAMANFLDRHLSFVRSVMKAIIAHLSSVVVILREQGMKARRAADAGSCPASVFLRSNAERTELPDRSFDLVTIMYAFHEAPKAGRDKILREARRLLRGGGTLAVVDISADYSPSKSMLAGEPYVIEYQQNIHLQIGSFRGFMRPKYETLVPGHVGMWMLKRSPNAA